MAKKIDTLREDVRDCVCQFRWASELLTKVSDFPNSVTDEQFVSVVIAVLESIRGRLSKHISELEDSQVRRDLTLD